MAAAVFTARALGISRTGTLFTRSMELPAFYYMHRTCHPLLLRPRLPGPQHIQQHRPAALLTIVALTPSSSVFSPSSVAEDDSAMAASLLDKLRIRQLNGLRCAPKSKSPAETSVKQKKTTSSSSSSSQEAALAMSCSFDELSFSDELRVAVDQLGLTEPTEVQCRSIPAVLDGQSVDIELHTGSGKTLAYMIPLVQVLEPSLSKGERMMVFCNTLNSCRAIDHFLSENSIPTVNYHGAVPAEESSLDELQRDCMHQMPRCKEENSQLGVVQSCNRSGSHILSRWVGQVCGRLGSSSPYSSSMLSQRWSSCLFARSLGGKGREDRKKRDLARREFQLLRRKAKLMRATLSPEERLLWRLRKSNRKKAVLLQRLKKYELEEDPEPVHDPELITPEQLQALKKIGYKNRNYVPVGRRGVYGGVVQNMHMHWKFHETVQVDCHIFKREDIRSIARQLATLSGGIVIDIHQSTTIIMYRGRNYKQPKTEMIPPNTLTKRKALFKSKFLQALEGLETNIRDIEAELQVVRRKQKEGVAKGGENDSSKAAQILGDEVVGSSSLANLSDFSSDEDEDDDGIFSWDSDSLDEDELSGDAEFNYKKAEEVHIDEEKATKPISWTSGNAARRSGKRNPLTAKELITAEQELFKNSPKRHADGAQKSGLVSSQNGDSNNRFSLDFDNSLKPDDDNNGENGDGITAGDLQALQSPQVDSKKLLHHTPEVKEVSSTGDHLEVDVESDSSCNGAQKSEVASRRKGHDQIKNKKIAKFVEDYMTDEDEEDEEVGTDFDDLDEFNESKTCSTAAVKWTRRSRGDDRSK